MVAGDLAEVEDSLWNYTLTNLTIVERKVNWTRVQRWVIALIAIGKGVRTGKTVRRSQPVWKGLAARASQFIGIILKIVDWPRSQRRWRRKDI